MEKLTINNNNNQSYDSKMEKARALLFDEAGNIYVCEMNGSLILPGGTVEPGEDHFDTINRELKEELGITNIPLKELIQVEYYHDGFPKYKQEGNEIRLNVVYYYYSNVPVKIDLNLSNFSDYEIVNNIKVSTYSIEELLSKVNSFLDNKWKRFTDLEMMTVLKVVQDKRLIIQIR